MSELKPCQMTADEAISALEMCQALMLFDPMTGETHELCEENNDNQDLYNACSLAIDALRRAQPANEPLTLEQLRQMDGEPVWVEHFAQTKFASAWIEVGEYGLVDAKLQRIVFMKNAPVMFEKYKGDFAIAYDHKPGGEQE